MKYQHMIKVDVRVHLELEIRDYTADCRTCITTVRWPSVQRTCSHGRFKDMLQRDLSHIDDNNASQAHACCDKEYRHGRGIKEKKNDQNIFFSFSFSYANANKQVYPLYHCPSFLQFKSYMYIMKKNAHLY